MERLIQRAASIPCFLVLPSLLFLGVGSFTSTAGLQKFFSSGSGPKILMGFGIAALVWIAYQLTTLLRTWRTASAQPMGELFAVHRFRLGTALGAATTGTLLLWRGFGDAGPDGRTIHTFHLLDALNTFFVRRSCRRPLSRSRPQRRRARCRRCRTDGRWSRGNESERAERWGARGDSAVAAGQVERRATVH